MSLYFKQYFCPLPSDLFLSWQTLLYLTLGKRRGQGRGQKGRKRVDWVEGELGKNIGLRGNWARKGGNTGPGDSNKSICGESEHCQNVSF